VVLKSQDEIEIQASDEITLDVLMREKNRSLEFSLTSPKLERRVTYEEVSGSWLLDTRLDDELKSPNHEAEEVDIVLALDLLGAWGKENGFSVTQKA
jgi:hypothetical protein